MDLITIVGARPQFIKAAAVSSAFKSLGPDKVSERIVHTGQHYDAGMSEVFFEELGVPAPSLHLGIGSGSHGAQTGRMMIDIEAACLDQMPEAMMVYGDTNSTVAGALVAAKFDLPLIHVEAGLRSGVRSMPEEVNRVVTDHVSTMLLCPCERAVNTLAHEGITTGVHNVGDVMLDVLQDNLVAARPVEETLAEHRIPPGDPIAVVTVHRPANTDDSDRLAEVVAGVNSLASEGWRPIWPVHPRVGSRLDRSALHERVHAVSPLSYLELLGLMRSSGLVLTDSGGVQREAFWLGVPCVTLRAETEWPETVEAGFNRLWVDRDTPLIQLCESALRSRGSLGDPPPVYGTGIASRQIADLVAEQATRGVQRV